MHTDVSFIVWVTLVIVSAGTVSVERHRYRKLHGPRYAERANQARVIASRITLLLIASAIATVGTTAMWAVGAISLTTFLWVGSPLAGLLIAAIKLSVAWAKELDHVERRIGLGWVAKTA